MDHRKLQVKITKAYQNSYQIHSQGKTWQPTLFRLQTLQKKKRSLKIRLECQVQVLVYCCRRWLQLLNDGLLVFEIPIRGRSAALLSSNGYTLRFL